MNKLKFESISLNSFGCETDLSVFLFNKLESLESDSSSKIFLLLVELLVILLILGIINFSSSSFKPKFLFTGFKFPFSFSPKAIKVIFEPEFLIMAFKSSMLLFIKLVILMCSFMSWNIPVLVKADLFVFEE